MTQDSTPGDGFSSPNFTRLFLQFANFSPLRYTKPPGMDN